MTNGKVSKKWETGAKIIHLLKVINPYPPYEFAFCSLEIPSIKIIGPSLKSEERKIEVDSDDLNKCPINKYNEFINSEMREIMEEVMGHFGDKILKVMHNQNWQQRDYSMSFFEFIMSNNDEECKSLKIEVIYIIE